MKNNPRLLIYIMINIFVSAITVLTILWIWEKANPCPEVTAPLLNLTDETSQPSPLNNDSSLANDSNPEPTLDFIDTDIQMSIRTVVGAGNLEMEYVEIFNQSQGMVNLTGWKLLNDDNQQFTFPTMILNSGGAIKIYSKSGRNSGQELYWQADTPVWGSGMIVRLIDASNHMMSTYSIP